MNSKNVNGTLRNEQFDIEDSDFFHFHMNGFVHPELFMIPQESPFELHPSIWGIMPKDEKGLKQNDYYKKGSSLWRRLECAK